MRLPDFLIIGAMKAGTTTLYRDLLTHPGVFFPIDKEPDRLITDEVLTGRGREEYAAMFAGAGADQVCGEASTSSTKRPTHEGVPARARALLGPETKLVYIVRDPAARAASQHFHELNTGAITEPDFNKAVREHPHLLEYSRYAMQALPWIDAFGAGNLLMVPFEHYTANRQETLGEVQAFLGLDPRPELIDEDRVFNKGDAKPMVKGAWQRIQHSALYTRVLRPLLGPEVRERLREMLLPKGRSRPSGPTPETEAWIDAQLADDRFPDGVRWAGGVPGWMHRDRATNT